MKSIIKTGKQGIIALLTLCILLGVVETCVNVAAMVEENTVAIEVTTVVEENTVVVEEKTFGNDVIDNTDIEEKDELQPMMANGCGVNPDAFFNNPSLFAGYTPSSLYYSLSDSYNIQPLSGGSLAGISFFNGGGYKVTWGGDKLLSYHPAGGHHNGAYYKLSSGFWGTHRYNLSGQEID